MSPPSASFRVLTYNIHHCQGTDGRYDPYRIAQVLREIDADIAGLQEVDTSMMVPLGERRAGSSQLGEMHKLQFLQAETGYKAIEGATRLSGEGRYGNAILSRHELASVRHIDLSVRGSRERRGALDVDLTIRGHPV